jgi:hypothetical protein
MSVTNLIDLISELEDQKWNLVLAGAEVKPELQYQMDKIDHKLEKLYAWFGTAMKNGLVDRYPSTPFGPGVPNPKERRKGPKVV